MASINEKLNYINETKTLIKDKLNDLGSEIEDETTFREYAEKIEDLYDEWPKINDEDVNINLNNTKKGKINLLLKGNINQFTTTGKNLFKPILTATKRGITFTNNNDGSYTLNGTAEQNVSFYITNVNYNAGTYTLSVNNITTLNDGSYLMLETSNGNKTVTFSNINAKQTFTVDDIKVLTCVISSGTVCNNFIIKPQLELGTSATSYEPYTGGIASPNPNYSQDIQIVTGDNTIIISNEDNTESQTFNINLGDLELCKIGNYQDYIYKDNNKWYLHKETKKILLNGSESWYAVSSDNNWYEYGCNNIIVGGKSGYNNCLTNYFSNQTNNRCLNNSNSCLIRTPDITITTVALFKTWLSNNNVSVYYMLATPINVEIEDITLIEQLEALILTNSYETQTSISQTNDNLPFIINATALMKNSD